MFEGLAELMDLTEAGLAGLVLVFARVGAVMGLLPGFGEQMIPVRVRLALAVAFTMVVWPMLVPELVAADPARPFLAMLIVVGSRRLAHFDAALVGYTFATLFSVFGLTYRYAMWLQRPPTALYWKRGWQVFLRPKYLARNMAMWFARLTHEFALNHFIARRGAARWGAHMLIMWGCMIAIAITFPLIFG